MSTEPQTDAVEANPAAEASPPTGRILRIVGWVRASKTRLAACGSALLLGLFGMIFVFSAGGEVLEPSEQLQRALLLLDESDSEAAAYEAMAIAVELNRLNYNDPNFPGAPEYIQGMANFRAALSADEAGRRTLYKRAAKYLTDAGFLAIDQEHRPEWAYALGKCQFYLGNESGAEARLLDAIETYPEGYVDSMTLLQEIYLHRRTEESLKRALELNDRVLARNNNLPAELDRTYLCRAETLLVLGRADEAEQALSKISPETLETQPAQIVRAEIQIVTRRFKDARGTLEPISRDVSDENIHARQASYLIGNSFELEGDLDNASMAYSETSRRYDGSAEGMAASLRRAELLRRDKRTEEALAYYKRALKMVKPDGYINRWLTLVEFRESILKAWNDWTADQLFDAAIDLARHMYPLFSEIEARQKAASAIELSALQLDDELEKATFTIRRSRRSELHERWRRSGKAYADLAAALISSPKYADALWMSAQHYRNALDSENALVQLTKFESTNSRERLALAYVTTGKVLMDLDRLDEALAYFEKVILDYPADIAAFEARFVIGSCRLERNEPHLAEKSWRELLTSRDLDPSAEEWQLALFSLGRLLYQSAVMLEAKQQSDPLAFENQGPTPELMQRWEETISRLKEFVNRYPDRPEVPEARCLFAKALQHAAELPRFKLRKAETENARNELVVAMHTRLREAHDQFERLQNQLIEADKADMLDELSQKILRDCYFERAHTLFGLDELEKAIAAYTSAANRYPEDPQVLLAYLQLANCYAKMGKTGDARGAAIQALLIFKNMPEKVFQAGGSNISFDEWKNWLEWAREIHLTSPFEAPRISVNERGPTS
ncbi:MAG: tetratricopeptide repeat protein [Planctomycetaceae bacterium]